jgi:hypothetical protein
MAGEEMELSERFAKLKELIEVHRTKLGELDDELEALKKAILGEMGPGDPRLLSVVPEDLESLLRDLDAATNGQS